MNVERLPRDAVRPVWSSASALVYVGGFVALFATVALLGIAGRDRDWALVGASLLACAVALVLAVALERAGRAIAAGVAATLAVVFAGVVVGALLNAIGVLDSELGDYQPAALVVEATLVAAALAAVLRFRAPLPILPAALAFWFALADLSSLGSWDNAGEWLSVFAGLLLVGAGIALDRAARAAYAFWLHAVGGLAAGGGLVFLAGEDAWLLTALIGLAFVATAFALGRSSYAVLGALGILIATTLFAVDPSALIGPFFLFGEPPSGDGLEDWQVALSYLVAGLAIAAIGVAGRLTWPRRVGPEAAGR